MPPAGAPEPDSPLARYRRLSPKAGVFVSPLQLGTMSLGTKWKAVGTTDKETAFKFLDTFFEAGGNFIDTANFYQDGESEEWLGEWMEVRGIRDQIVLATKYSGSWAATAPTTKQQATYIGNCTKSMKLSVDASLKKLRTSYIDILYVHWWDWTTSIEDVMDGLHALITQGKVLWLGASNMPAWVVAKGNQYARDHGRPQFVIYQGEWNVLLRDVERDIIPLCRNDGMAFAPWGMLCSGRLRTDAEEEERERQGKHGRVRNAPDWKRTEVERRVSGVLEKIANEVGTKNIRSVLIAYHLQKMPYVFPMFGGNKVEQLLSNIDALNIILTDEHIKEIESMAPFEVGFPHKSIGNGSTPEPNNASRIFIDVEPFPGVIRPKAKK